MADYQVCKWNAWYHHGVVPDGSAIYVGGEDAAEREPPDA